MPGLLDKVRLNGGCIASGDAIYEGNSAAIKISYKGAEGLAEEIMHAGKLNDPAVLGFLTNQIGDCEEVEKAQDVMHAAQRKHLDAMDARNEAMRLWIDQHIKP